MWTTFNYTFWPLNLFRNMSQNHWILTYSQNCNIMTILGSIALCKHLLNYFLIYIFVIIMSWKCCKHLKRGMRFFQFPIHLLLFVYNVQNALILLFTWVGGCKANQFCWINNPLKVHSIMLKLQSIVISLFKWEIKGG